MPDSASTTASLILRQLVRVGHSASMSQAPSSGTVQSVSAIGPSTAAMISVIGTLAASRISA